jgi:hypothetical protein
MYTKIENDDSRVEEELRRRGIWESFISSKQNKKSFCWHFFEKSGLEQVDIFIGYSGFSNPEDNGFSWFRIKNPQNDQKAFESIIHSMVSNLTEIEGFNPEKKISRINLCAYCGNMKKLTREHIFPKFIIRKESDMVSFSEKANKLTKTELVIKDVCTQCNSGELSKLDNYISQLYDSYFAKFVRENELLQFSYDFGKLARWLLKVSYNSSRAVRIDADILRGYSKVILTDGEIPERLMIFLDIVTPTTVQPGNVAFKGRTEIMPNAMRAARFYVPDNSKLEQYTTRLVSLNSYYFYIVIIPEEVNESEIISKEEINYFIPGTYLDPNKTEITVVGSERDALTNYLSMAKTAKERNTIISI